MGNNHNIMLSPTERLNVNITTTSGDLQTHIDIPTDFIPISKIVPLVRSLGDQAQELEITKTTRAGKTISCQKGCAACCRPMIPVSPPEAFTLVETINDLPQEHQNRIKHNLATTKQQLEKAGLLHGLQDLIDSPHQITDHDLDILNRTYYAQRLPCIFLENEVCSIYDHRPAGCRGHLVTSPAEWCQDMDHNPIEELHIPLRAGTVLSLLWANMNKKPVRLLPLPLAVEWAETNQHLNTSSQTGADLINNVMEALGTYLQYTLVSHGIKKASSK